ncbi:hypothetical protein [Paenibacillus solani]|uniref:hypothetical protein n=1 Tax=Paenibacillus solani TaxID=1705565 RepID=UPI003D28F943
MNMEKEIKVLDIDVEQIQRKLIERNATFKSDVVQQIYVYDLMTIYSRFCDVLSHLRNISFDYQYSVCRDKLNVIFQEIDDLTSEEQKKMLFEMIETRRFVDILKQENEGLLDYLSKVEELVKAFAVNPNKWIRLRKTGDKTTLTIKQIMNNSSDRDELVFQNVSEVEVVVPSIEEGESLLCQLGFAFRNYQEKRRISYIYQGLKIDIDLWPMIPPYLEIEGDDNKEIMAFCEMMEFGAEQLISCNTEEIYRKYGINIYNHRELKLDTYQ